MFARTLSFAFILAALPAAASVVVYDFETNPQLAPFRPVAGSPFGPGLSPSAWSPDQDPDGTGFTAVFGANAPAGTFAIAAAPPPGYVALFPGMRMSTQAIGEIGAYDGTDYPLQITTSLAVTAIQFEWTSAATAGANAYVVVSDGLGNSQTFYDDGSASVTMEGGFIAGVAAGFVTFLTSAPTSTITITAYETLNTSVPGVHEVQALVIDDIRFTVVPEPAAASLGAGALGLLVLRRRRA